MAGCARRRRAAPRAAPRTAARAGQSRGVAGVRQEPDWPFPSNAMQGADDADVRGGRGHWQARRRGRDLLLNLINLLYKLDALSPGHLTRPGDAPMSAGGDLGVLALAR